MEPLSLRRARPNDWPAIAALLRDAGLPLAGAHAHRDDFVLAFRGGRLVGCAGLERYGQAALLRSVAVSASERGAGVGRALVAQALDCARAAGARQVVLLTETAADYFARLGFAAIAREAAPEAVRASAEFTGACPETATVMALRLPPGAS